METIKEEKKADLEQLLNSLIERGWCPIGKKYTGPHKPFISSDENRVHGKQFYYNEYWDGGYGLQKVFTLREIVSINSGLWQFVCENGMVEKGGLFWELGYSSGEIDLESRRRRQDYEYRLIEASLKDESGLEDFLLNSIKLD